LPGTFALSCVVGIGALSELNTHSRGTRCTRSGFSSKEPSGNFQGIDNVVCIPCSTHA
jgi:hypothetical protein